MELRRPECFRSAIARRPARMLSSARSRGRARVRHSLAGSTPPVRSVHPMDPIGSVGRGWLIGPLSSVVSRPVAGTSMPIHQKPAPGTREPGQWRRTDRGRARAGAALRRGDPHRRRARATHPLGDGNKELELSGGARLRPRTGVICTGVAYRRLDAPGVEELIGCGVAYGPHPPRHRPPRPARCAGRRRELRRPGRATPRELRALRDHRRARRLAGRRHVALPRRPHPQIHGSPSAPAPVSRGRRAARGWPPSPAPAAMAVPKGTCMPRRSTS